MVSPIDTDSMNMATDISQVPGPVRDAEIAYLVTGVLPTATEQTFISVFEVGQTIPDPEDPYSVPVGPAAGDGFDVLG